MEVWPLSLVVERNRVVGRADTYYNACIAAGLGSALGQTIGSGNVVVTGRDGKGFSRLMKRALTCGVMERGVQVLDARLVPEPVVRYCVVETRSDYGVYIGFYWKDQTKLAATFFGRDGAILDEGMVNQIVGRTEEDEVAVSAREVGDIIFYAEARANYFSEVLKLLDVGAISSAAPKVLLDCSNGAVSVTLPPILRELGCHVIPTRDDPSAYMTHGPVMFDDSLMSDFAGRVAKDRADIGIALDPCGESARFVDREGRVISQVGLGLLLAESMGAQKILLNKDLLSESSRFSEAGSEALPLEASHEMMLPEDVQVALGEDYTCYLGDGTRRWWDALPVCLKMVELVSSRQNQ
jgi:phosphomannomutase